MNEYRNVCHLPRMNVVSAIVQYYICKSSWYLKLSVQKYSQPRMYTFGIIIIFSVQFFCNLALQEEKCSGHLGIPPNYESFNRPSHKELLIVSVNFSNNFEILPNILLNGMVQDTLLRKRAQFP